MYSETWPRWGWLLDGECSAHPTPALPTYASASGLWPTPKASAAGPDFAKLTRSGPEAARTISAGGSYELKLFGTPGYVGTVAGITVYADPFIPEHTVEVRDDLGRVLGRIVNVGGSSRPQESSPCGKP